MPTSSWNQTLDPDPPTSVFVLQVLNISNQFLTQRFPVNSVPPCCKPICPGVCAGEFWKPPCRHCCPILPYEEGLCHWGAGDKFLVVSNDYIFDRLTPTGAPSLALVSRRATRSWECRTTGTRSGVQSGSAPPPLSTSASRRACATIQTPAPSTAGGSGVRAPCVSCLILSRWSKYKTTQT